VNRALVIYKLRRAVVELDIRKMETGELARRAFINHKQRRIRSIIRRLLSSVPLLALAKTRRFLLVEGIHPVDEVDRQRVEIAELREAATIAILTENINLREQNRMLRNQISGKLTAQMVEDLLGLSSDELEICRLDGLLRSAELELLWAQRCGE